MVVGDSADGGGGTVQGVQEPAGGSFWGGGGGGHRGGGAVRGQHRDQRLHCELLSDGDPAEQGVHGGGVRGVPDCGGGGIRGGVARAGGPQDRLHGASPHRVPAPGEAHRRRRRVLRRAQRGGTGIQRQAGGGVGEVRRGAAGAEAEVCAIVRFRG